MGNYIQEDVCPYNVWTMSKDMKTENGSFEIPVSWNSTELGGRYPYSTYKDAFYYTTPMDYTIYQMNETDGRFYPKYRFDLGDKNWPEDAKEAQQYEEIRRKHPFDYVCDFGYFQETERYLLARFILAGKETLGVYDKREKKSQVASLTTYTDKYFIPFGQVIGMDVTAIYSLVPAWYLKKIWSGKDERNDFESKYPEQVKRLREKFESIDEEGNPFLLIHSLNG